MSAKSASDIPFKLMEKHSSVIADSRKGGLPIAPNACSNIQEVFDAWLVKEIAARDLGNSGKQAQAKLSYTSARGTLSESAKAASR